MASLQQQLLKAGIADKKKLKKVAAEKRRETAELRSQQQQASGKSGKKKNKKAPVITPAQAAAAKAQQEKAARDRALNEAKNAEAAAKALRAQIVQLVSINEAKRDGKDADVAYRFTHNNSQKVDTIYVTVQQKDQLSRGVLAIVQLNEQFSLVPASVADKIKTRDASVIASQHEAKLSKGNESEAADDPYADFQIPDDFDW